MIDHTILILVVTVVAMTIVFGLIFTHIYVRQVYKGIDFWIYGLIIEAVAFNLFLLGHANTDYFNYLIANIFLTCGLILFYVGMNRFVNHDTKYIDVYIAIAFTFLMLIIFHYVVDIRMIRQLTMSSLIIFIMTRLIMTLNLNYFKDRSGYLLPFIIVTYGIILSQVVRIILILFDLNSSPILADQLVVDDLIMIIISGFVAMLAFFMTIAINIRGVSDLNQERLKLQHLSLTDYLTGLPNRRMLNQHMEKLIEAKIPFAVVICDMDEFKSINDIHGHDIGDRVIQSYAQRLVENNSTKEFIARYGGDEFITIYSKITNVEELKHFICEKEALISKPISINDIKFEISSSVGIARFPDDALELSEIIKKSDEALYVVKQSGKHGIKFYCEIKKDK